MKRIGMGRTSLIVSAAVLSLGLGHSLWAADAETPAVIVEANAEAVAGMERFFHYARVGRFDLANTEAQAILEKSAVRDVADAIEVAAKNRKEDADERLDALANAKPIAETVAKLQRALLDGRKTRSEDIAWLESQVARLHLTARAYELGMAQLRTAGDASVPMLLNVFRDENRAKEIFAITSALKDLGNAAILPLIEAAQTTDSALQLRLQPILGGSQAPEAAAAIVAVLVNEKQSDGAREAALRAAKTLGIQLPKTWTSIAEITKDPSRNKALAGLYIEQAEIFLRKAIAVDEAGKPGMANYWSWNPELPQPLFRQSVPQAIVPSLLAMRAARRAMELEPGNDQAIVLWLSANLKREGLVPAGLKDPTRKDNDPGAVFFGVYAGPKHLSGVLDRGISEKDPVLTSQAVAALSRIAGVGNYAIKDSTDRLVGCLASPDPKVRYAVALMLANTADRSAFPGSDMVVTSLCEMINRSLGASVALVADTDAQAKPLRAVLEDAGYRVFEPLSPTVRADMGLRAQAPEVIVIAPGVQKFRVTQIETAVRGGINAGVLYLDIASQNVKRPAQTFTNFAVQVVGAPTKDEVLGGMDKLRAQMPQVKVDADQADAYAQQAAAAMQRLLTVQSAAVEGGDALPVLVAALGQSKKPEVAKAVASALSSASNAAAQPALVALALDPARDAALRVVSLKAAAANARTYGGKVTDARLVKGLSDLVTSAETPELKVAAAEVHGALSLPAAKVRDYILAN